MSHAKSLSRKGRGCCGGARRESGEKLNPRRFSIILRDSLATYRPKMLVINLEKGSYKFLRLERGGEDLVIGTNFSVTVSPPSEILSVKQNQDDGKGLKKTAQVLYSLTCCEHVDREGEHGRQNCVGERT